jgi:hypothetical protein
MCGQTGPVTSTVSKTNDVINQIDSTDSGFNSQLQSFLGSLSNSPAASSLPSIESGLQNFSATGGITPGMTSSIDDQAAQAAQGAYSTASDTANRQLAATGGYGDVGAIDANLARTGSAAGANAVNSANSQLVPLTTSNELSGLTGQAGLYTTNAQQQQSIINSILQLFSTSVGGINSALGTQAGLSVAPGSGTIASNNISNLVGALMP